VVHWCIVRSESHLSPRPRSDKGRRAELLSTYNVHRIVRQRENNTRWLLKPEGKPAVGTQLEDVLPVLATTIEQHNLEISDVTELMIECDGEVSQSVSACCLRARYPLADCSGRWHALHSSSWICWDSIASIECFPFVR